MQPSLNRTKSLWDLVTKTLRLGRAGRFPYKSEHFSVAPKTAWELVYTEIDRSLIIETGIGSGEKVWDTWTTIDMTKKLAWEPPHEREKISAEKKAEIIVNLRAAFEALKSPYEIQFPDDGKSEN